MEYGTEGIPSESRKSIQRLFQKLRLEMARNSARLGREVWKSSQDKRRGQCEWGTAVDRTRAGRLSVPSLLHPHPHPMHAHVAQEEGWKAELVCLQKADAFVFEHVFFSMWPITWISRSWGRTKKMAKIEILWTTRAPRKRIRRHKHRIFLFTL